MLVLTRKSAETIQIGDDIVVKVIKTGSGTVKIGIDAPQSVRVIRGELLETIPVETAEDTSVLPSVYGGVASDQFPHVA
jgi:carbon storage regulator CsrA